MIICTLSEILISIEYTEKIAKELLHTPWYAIMLSHDLRYNKAIKSDIKNCLHAILILCNIYNNYIFTETWRS